jgi:hypothetical protein
MTRPASTYGSEKSTAFLRSSVIDIADAMTSIWPAFRAEMSASKPRSLNCTLNPAFAPIARIRSMSNPTNSPFSPRASKGGKVGSVPTVIVTAAGCAVGEEALLQPAKLNRSTSTDPSSHRLGMLGRIRVDIDASPAAQRVAARRYTRLEWLDAGLDVSQKNRR